LQYLWSADLRTAFLIQGLEDQRSSFRELPFLSYQPCLIKEVLGCLRMSSSLISESLFLLNGEHQYCFWSIKWILPAILQSSSGLTLKFLVLRHYLQDRQFGHEVLNNDSGRPLLQRWQERTQASPIDGRPQ